MTSESTDRHEEEEEQLQNESKKKVKLNGSSHCETGIGNANSAHGKRFRQLNDQINACGASEYIDTPTIAIIGSQSTGKSSVLEAISEIAFPRAAGTCTRCPTEVRLFNAANQPWTCTITLRFETDNDGHPLPETQTVGFGEPLTDKRLVQERITAAQRAILNPSKDPALFLLEQQKSDGTENELGFSENKICLEVHGADLVDLSIIDLPGIISNAGEGEEESSIELIKGLARKTISKPNCLILTTITMGDDFQNQIGVTMAKEADPTGMRTLGVLTKADKVDKCDLDPWLAILEGKTNRNLHGYYAVKNPSSEELKQGISSSEARAKERAFFQQEPWRSMSARAAKRLGAKNLGRRLEVLLEKLIQTKLPETLAEIRRMSLETNAKLDRLPTKIKEEESVRELYELCESFSKHFKFIVWNKDVQEATLLGWPLKILTARFRAKLLSTRPVVEPFDDETEECEEYPNCTVEEETFSDSELGQGVIPSDQIEGVMTAMKKLKVNKLMQNDSATAFFISFKDINNALCGDSEERLPGNAPLAAKEQFILQSIEAFEVVSKELFDDCLALLKNAAIVLVDESFADKFNSPLRDTVLSTVNKLIDEQFSACHKALLGKIRREQSFPFTLNHHYFTSKRDLYFDRLRQARIDAELHGSKVVANPFSGIMSTDGKPMKFDERLISFLKEHQIIQEDLNEVAKHRVPSDVNEKLMIGAEVLAYWQVAFKRFVDDIRSMITADLLRPVAESCFNRLRRDMDLLHMTPNKASSLLRHPDNVRYERDELEVKKKHLDRALEIIDDFHQGRLGSS